MIWTAKVVTGSGVGAEEILAKSSLCRRVTAIGALVPGKQDCYLHALRWIRQSQALTACHKLWVSEGRPFKLFESFGASLLDEAEEVFGSLEKPRERFSGDLKVLRVARLYIGFVETIVPGRESMLIAGPSFDEPPVMILGQAAQEFDVVRWRAVVGEGQEERRVSMLISLMKAKRCEAGPLRSITVRLARPLSSASTGLRENAFENAPVPP